MRGRPAGKRWVDLRENHFLDCRIYNMALADYLGMSITTPEQWAALARQRGMPAAATTTDLFTQPVLQPAPALPPDAPPAPERDWIGRRGRNWLR